jgi:hypothetical protein
MDSIINGQIAKSFFSFLSPGKVKVFSGLQSSPICLQEKETTGIILKYIPE